MNWKRNLLTVAISASLAACGGGGGSSSTSTTVSGTASKGIISFADVVAKNAAGVTVGTATTDENGDYSLTLNSSYTGGPIKIEVVGNSDAKMKCDVRRGCDGDGDGNPDTDGDGTPEVAFGGLINFGTGFTLRAVIPETSDTTVSTHVTALTDMAAKLAEDLAATTGTLNDDAVNVANSQVGALFGLSNTELVGSKPVDITDPEAIAALDSTESAQLRVALYSAAILSAVAQAEPADLAAALETFSDDFVSAGGQLLQDDETDAEAENTATVSLGDIIQEASALTDQDSVSGAISSVDTQLDTTLASQLDASEGDDNVGSTTTAAPSDEVLSTDLVQAQAMIGDLRDLAYAMGHMTNTPSSNMELLKGNADAFAFELETAGGVAGPAAQYLLEGLALATSTMADAVSRYAAAIEDPDTVAFEDPSYPGDPVAYANQIPGVTLTATNADEVADVSVTVTLTDVNVDPDYVGTDGINVVDLDLTFALDATGVQAFINSFEETLVEGDNTSTITETGGGSFSLIAELAGTVSGPTVQMTVVDTASDPSQVAVTLNSIALDWTETVTSTATDETGNWSSTFGFAPSDFSFDLSVDLTETDTDPASFEGRLGASFSGVSLDGADSGSWSWSATSYQDEASETISYIFDSLSLSMDGTFAQGTQQFAARFSANVGGSGFELTEQFNWGYNDTEGWFDNQTTSTTGFVTLNASLVFEADIDGFANNALVTLDVVRDAQTSGSAGMVVALPYENKQLNLDVVLEGVMDANDPGNLMPIDMMPTSIMLSNQDGIEITLQEEANGDVSGVITKGEGDNLEQLGTVSDAGLGVVTFYLRNGSEEVIETL